MINHELGILAVGELKELMHHLTDAGRKTALFNSKPFDCLLYMSALLGCLFTHHLDKCLGHTSLNVLISTGI